MDVQLRRPTHVRFGVATPHEGSRSRSSAISLAVDVVLRGLLVGVGIGALLMSAHAAIASVTVLGLLALGAALLSWGR